MADTDRRRSFVNALVKQDAPITADRWQEYRSRLETRLRRCRTRDRRMRVAILVMITVVTVTVLGHLLTATYAPGLSLGRALSDLLPDPIAATIVAAILACFVCLIPFLILQRFVYARRLQEAERDEMLAILAELERKVDDLQRQLGVSDTEEHP